MSELTTVKQDAFINSEKLSEWKIKIFGLGSIGSILAKISILTGFKDIVGYDFDTVDDENMGSQEFELGHIGMKKTDALQKLIKDRYGVDIAIVDGKIDDATTIAPEEKTIYFCGFDSLEARNMLWNKLKGFPIIWGESRIGLDQQQFYFVDLRTPDKDWIKDYEVKLDPSGPRSELKCGEKGTFASNTELCGKIVRQFVNIAEDKPIKQMYIGAWGGGQSIYREPEVEIGNSTE